MPLAEAGQTDATEAAGAGTVTGSVTAETPGLISIASLAISILAIGLLGYFYISSKKRY